MPDTWQICLSAFKNKVDNTVCDVCQSPNHGSLPTLSWRSRYHNLKHHCIIVGRI